MENDSVFFLGMVCMAKNAKISFNASFNHILYSYLCKTIPLSRAAPASICYQVPNYVIAIYRNYGCITTNHERRSIMNNIIICFSFTGIQRSCWGNHYHLKGVVWYNATSLYKLSTLLYNENTLNRRALFYLIT